MKRVWKIFLIGALMLTFMTLAVSASSAEIGEYTVTEAGGEYLLAVYSEGAQREIMRTSDFSEITKYIDELGLSECSVTFADVSIGNSIELSNGKYTLSGSLKMSDGASLTISGAEVSFCDMNTNFDSGSLRIKSGRASVEESEIYSAGCAVRLDYSSDAALCFKSGKIISAEDCAIKISYGICVIEGGEVSSQKSFAIKSSSTLALAGAPKISGKEYGIFTESPITASYGGKIFSGSVAVQYDSLFEKGSITCVFYEAEESSLENVRLYDKNGSEQALRYFSSHDRVDEKSFGAVYLPYTVNFFCDTELIKTVDVLSGDVLESQDANEKTGYKFSSWSIEKVKETPYDFAQNVNKSFDLYAKYSLLSPTFRLNSLEFTYDAVEHEFGIEELSHPLLDDAIINYTWYRDEVEISNSGPKIKLLNVSESGSYKCKINFTFERDSVTVITPAASVKIHKQKVPIPKIEDKYYTGKQECPDIFSTSIYTVSDAGGTIVGTYPVKITICDFENYEFSDGSEVCFSDFSILKAENFFTDELRISDIYETMTPSPQSKACFGEVEYLYSSEYDGKFTPAFPTSPGVYYCMAYVPGCENYFELKSSPVSFSLIEERLVGISIESMPERCEYTAFEAFDGKGLILSVSYNSKREELISHDKLNFSYQTADNLRFGDNAVIAKYLDLSIAVPVTVTKAKYDLSQLAFSDTSVTYDGTEKKIVYSGNLPIGLDGILLECSTSGGESNAGEYEMWLHFSSESPNYEIPQPLKARLTILPYESRVIFTDTEFVYDGSLKCPTAYYTDVYGRKVVVEVSGAGSLAGEYIAEAVCTDKNYKLLNPTATYNIEKANYDFGGVVWNAPDCVYDGEEKSVTVSGLPSGVSVIGYSDNKATAAGKYVARLTLSYDEKNYNPPEELYCEWEIKKADYDVTQISFIDSKLVYNGNEQYPSLQGKMPVGADGIALEYRFSKGATHVSDGKVTVEISFFSNSRNYNLPGCVYADVEILPMGISATWQHTEFTYNGYSHAPTATAKECQIVTMGAEKNAGSYTATAVSLSSDYYIINSTMDFVINKAENIWTSPISAQNIYEGRAPLVSASAAAGEIKILFFTDASCENPIDSPKAPGRYYARAYSEGDRNYGSILSEAVEFEIIKVIPVKLHVSMSRYDFFAFETLDFSDFSVRVENNDGSFLSPSGDAVFVEYSSADSLRFGDAHISISCMGFCERIDISVSKAEYDMSGVFWSDSSFEYDGEEKRITLLGLPDGISVAEYVGGVGKYAGEYPAEAVFLYDSYNYNQPTVPGGVLKIRKKVIDAPVIAPIVYSGVEQYPSLATSELYSAVALPGAAVGAYEVTFKLNDFENYEFSGGVPELTVYYQIEPRKITLHILDIDKYLFESLSEPIYVLEEGSFISGDELMLSFIYTEDEVSCICGNPNYSVTVIPGKIVRHNSLSEDGFFIAFLLLLLLLTLVLIFIVILRRRERISKYISVLKCRLSPIAREIAAEPVELPVSNEPNSEVLPKDVDTEGESEPKDEAEAIIEDVKASDEEAMPKSYNSVEDALSVDKERADDLITDSLAKNLLTKGENVIETDGTKKRIINVDTLSENFLPGDVVDVNILKNMSLVPYDTAYIKVLARGMIDKPLKVYANDFSLSAIKMIALTGGESIRVITVKRKEKE